VAGGEADRMQFVVRRRQRVHMIRHGLCIIESVDIASAVS